MIFLPFKQSGRWHSAWIPALGCILPCWANTTSQESPLSQVSGLWLRIGINGFPSPFSGWRQAVGSGICCNIFPPRSRKVSLGIRVKIATSKCLISLFWAIRFPKTVICIPPVCLLSKVLRLLLLMSNTCKECPMFPMFGAECISLFAILTTVSNSNPSKYW